MRSGYVAGRWPSSISLCGAFHCADDRHVRCVSESVIIGYVDFLSATYIQITGENNVPAEQVFVDMPSAAVLRAGEATPHVPKPQPIAFETPAYVVAAILST